MSSDSEIYQIHSGVLPDERSPMRSERFSYSNSLTLGKDTLKFNQILRKDPTFIEQERIMPEDEDQQQERLWSP